VLASRGSSSRVAATLGSALQLLPPGPGLMNGPRHLRTVSAESPRSAATPEFPSADSTHTKIIRARSGRRGSPDGGQSLKLRAVTAR
jgi:hypothetical protein